MPEVNGLPKFGTVHRLNDGYTKPLLQSAGLNDVGDLGSVGGPLV